MIEALIIDDILSWYDIIFHQVSKGKAKQHLTNTAGVEFWDSVDAFIKQRKNDTVSILTQNYTLLYYLFFLSLTFCF